MLATNHIFQFVGVIVLVTAAGIWLMPKPSGPVSMSMEGH